MTEPTDKVVFEGKVEDPCVDSGAWQVFGHNGREFRGYGLRGLLEEIGATEGDMVRVTVERLRT